jgi:hypothetical protein
MTDARQAYASARLHARYARRPGAAQWGALDASRTAAHYLDALRAGRWLYVPEGALATDVDERERWLRAAWREACEEVAGWHPTAWQRAFRWLAVLPDLDPLERLRADEPVPEWIHADPRLTPLADAAADLRAARLADGPYAPLRAAWLDGRSLGVAWRDHWHSTWPTREARTRRALETLEASVIAARGLAAASRRDAIEATARRIFRRVADTPAAAVAQLALYALQLERIRGGFARRDAVPEPGGAA